MGEQDAKSYESQAPPPTNFYYNYNSNYVATNEKENETRLQETILKKGGDETELYSLT